MENENQSLLDSLTGGKIDVNVAIDYQSIAILSIGLMVALIFGQVVSRTLVK